MGRSDPPPSPTRRAVLRGALAVPLVAWPRRAGDGDESVARAVARSLGFAPIALSERDDVVLPEGYGYEVVAAWGDALEEGLPAFDPERQTAELQRRRFGFNCDFNGFFPLPGARGRRGLLCVNHEYTTRGDMFPDGDSARPTAEEVAVELEAHGVSVLALERDAQGRWRASPGSPLQRRVTGTTPMRLTGPAAGAPLLRTGGDPEGRLVRGTLNDCSGGKTPWGTLLSCEENFHAYFGGAERVADERERAMLARYGLPEGPSRYGWEAFRPRFDLGREPHEANRFGWVVEIDPFDPDDVPRKRTALGRFRHEAACTALSDDGRVVVYMGDDEAFQYVYKFVSARRFRPGDRAANRDLLDAGTLFVARFEDDGTGAWLPLVPEGALAGWSRARILVHARAAADVLGATPMDRPEDVEVSPRNHHVYVALTNNAERAEGDGGPNPRAPNRAGHVLELVEDRGDLAARGFTWSALLYGRERAEGPEHAGDVLACPDNLAFDSTGNLWVATDGQGKVLDANDALYAVPTAGLARGRALRFLSGPRGCEICGPELTPDGRTLFVGIQHPGEGGGTRSPTSRWPDGEGLPRPAVIAVERLDGGRVGA